MKDLKEILTQCMRPGSVQSMLFWGVLGLVCAVLLLTLGFFKTLLIALCCLAGCFVGGVSDKRAFLSKLLSPFFKNDHYRS